MANLIGHKAGNGRYSQGHPNVLIDSSPTRREIRVDRPQPVATSPALIEAARPLRNDALEAELARLVEHHRALGGERFGEHDAVAAPLSDQAQERFSPLLKRPLAQVVDGFSTTATSALSPSRCMALGDLAGRRAPRSLGDRAGVEDFIRARYIYDAE